MTSEEKTEFVYFGGLLKLQTRLAWPNFIGITLLHIFGTYGLFLAVVKIIKLQLATPLFAVLFGSLSIILGSSIAAHKYYAHKSFKARLPLRLLLSLANCMACNYSGYIWARDHRAHHKYSDTDGDPYNPKRGFLFSQMGWLCVRKHPELLSKSHTIDMSDLHSDRIVMFQNKYFVPLAVIFGIILPVYVPVYYWNEDWWTSSIICFCTRWALFTNIALSINSVAHVYGNKPYNRKINPTDNQLIHSLTLGDGFHNFHHAFPVDYRSSDLGIRPNYATNILEFFERIGWAYDLKTVSDEFIRQSAEMCGDGSYDRIKLIHESEQTINDTTTDRRAILTPGST